MNENQLDGKKKKITIVSILVIVAAVILIGVHVYSNSPAQQAKKQIALGSSFLSDLNYQEAVNAFRQAIEMNSSNKEAWKGMGATYIAWGKDYIEQEDYDNAITVLQEGITTLQELSDTYDMDVSDSLKQIEDLKTKTETAREEKIKEEKEREEARKRAEKREREKAERRKKRLEARAKLDQIAAKLKENPAGVPELDESFADICDLLEVAGNGNSYTYICPTKSYGFYGFDQWLMLYVGPYVKNKRSGTGSWIDLSDKEDGNYVKCEWTNDSPNGDFIWCNYVYYSGYDEVKQKVDARGTVKDGLYDGALIDGMWEGSHFDSGKMKLIRTLSESELRDKPDQKYVVAEYPNGGYSVTNQQGIDGIYGLYGYGDGSR